MMVVTLESYWEILVSHPYFLCHLQTKMASSVEHFVMSPTVKWYYNGVRNVVVVTTTATMYTPLHIGHIKNLVEVPLVPAPANLPKFLWPPLAQPKHKFIQEPEPLPDYTPYRSYGLCL